MAAFHTFPIGIRNWKIKKKKKKKKEKWRTQVSLTVQSRNFGISAIISPEALGLWREGEVPKLSYSLPSKYTFSFMAGLDVKLFHFVENWETPKYYIINR